MQGRFLRTGCEDKALKKFFFFFFFLRKKVCYFGVKVLYFGVGEIKMFAHFFVKLNELCQLLQLQTDLDEIFRNSSPKLR